MLYCKGHLSFVGLLIYFFGSLIDFFGKLVGEK
jgi:hypothetical protein